MEKGRDTFERNKRNKYFTLDPILLFQSKRNGRKYLHCNNYLSHLF